MDIERALISKCVNSGLVETLVSRGISNQHFEDEQNRAVFMTVVNHMSTYGAPPSRDAVLMQHPQYRLDVVEDTMDYIIDLFVKKTQRREAQRSVLDIAARLDDPNDNVDIDALFMEHAERVAQAVPSSRISRLSEVASRIALYNKMLREGRIPGIPLGIPSLDSIVLGIQHHELVVVAAPSSWGKSTMLQHICLSSYLAGAEHRPVFISLEMEGDALLRKFDTMATNFEYRALRALELGEGDLERWEKWGERCRSAPNDIIIIDDISELTVERVFAETLRWKPSAMFVDYFGIMTPSRGRDQKEYVGMANMAKALKRIPRSTKIPLFTAGQTNRQGFKEGVRGDNIADTIELFRSADIMLGLEYDEDDAPDELLVKLVKARDSAKGSTKMHWDYTHMHFYEKDKFGGKNGGGANPLGEVHSSEPPSIMDNPFFLQTIAA